MPPTKKYRVLNPRNHPEGVRVISYQDLEWFPGEEFVTPSGMSEKSLSWLLELGLLEPATQSREAQ